MKIKSSTSKLNFASINQKLLFFCFFLSVLLTNNIFAQKAKTIVLVHGAWADASAWNLVKPGLQKKGYEVLTVNLPGHGKDSTAFNSIHLQNYADEVIKVIGKRKNVILVGHSMAGMVISKVAETIPNQLKSLLFMAAYLPQNGDNLVKISSQDAGSYIGKNLVIDQQNTQIILKKEFVTKGFFADVPAEIAQNYLNKFKQNEPLLPFVYKISLSQKHFGKVNKAYVFCTEDQAISYPFQQQMVERTAVHHSYTLKAGHNPHISKPKDIVEIILKEAKTSMQNKKNESKR